MSTHLIEQGQGGIWDDAPNPLVAKAENVLYLAGAKALEGMLKEIAAVVGVPPEPTERAGDE